MGNKGHTWERVCVICGETFQATSTTGKYCFKPECQEQHRLISLQMKRDNAARRRAEGVTGKPSDAEKKAAAAVRSFKKSDRSIREIVRQAEELGLSYGQYVGRYGK